MSSIISYATIGPSMLCKPVSSDCGYCGQSQGSQAYYMLAQTLTGLDYERLLDRGWRRSGHLLYLPSYLHIMSPAQITKCPCLLEPIRTPVASFRPSKAQGKKWKRWTGKPELTLTLSPSLNLNLNPSTHRTIRINDRFHILMAPSHFSEASYALFLSYQQRVHQEDPTKWSRSAYSQFLVSSPLIHSNPNPNPNPNDTMLDGSYHMCYYDHDNGNERLMAVSVVDLLPNRLSAVYFSYCSSPDLDPLSLGTLSALVELALARALGKAFYTLGYYSSRSQKMAYKAQFKPCELLQMNHPENERGPSYSWIPFITHPNPNPNPNPTTNTTTTSYSKEASQSESELGLDFSTLVGPELASSLHLKGINLASND